MSQGEERGDVFMEADGKGISEAAAPAKKQRGEILPTPGDVQKFDRSMDRWTRNAISFQHDVQRS